MEEKKRYAWIEMYRGGEPMLTYDQMGVKESFNEFFENVIHIDKGKDIQKYYRISLHLIMFLTVQKQIRDETECRMKIHQEEIRALEMRAQDLFWPATKRMPKAFIFNKVPSLTVPEEKLQNIKEIVLELAHFCPEEETHPRHVQQNILKRALRGEHVSSSGVFAEDGFDVGALQSIFKLFLRLKHNKIANEFYRKYETAYFLNCYCRDRFKTYKFPFLEEDIRFFSMKKEKDQNILPRNPEEKNFEIKLADRKFAIILSACILEFSKRTHLPKQAEALLLATARVFLSKEESLGYFEDYSSEVLLVAFAYIANHAYKRNIQVHSAYEVFREMGFILPFCLVDLQGHAVTIEDVLQLSIVKTYNKLLPSIIRHMRSERKVAAQEDSSEPRTPKRTEEKRSNKYILSPLSGRMCQILPVDVSSKKALFKEEKR